MNVSYALNKNNEVITLSELEMLTGCSIVLNGDRPEVALSTSYEVQRFKLFVQTAVADCGSSVKQRVMTHVWERLRDPMECRAFARYFLEGWLSANNINFSGLVAYSSLGVPSEVIKPFIIRSKGRIRKVSDFGFGQLSTLEPWIDLGVSVSGFDMIPFCVEAAERSGIFARVAQIDGEYGEVSEAFDIESESQDLVTTTLTLDRVSRPRQLLHNMMSSLRSEGYILIHTLLPVVSYDDGPNLAARIEYTKADNRITTGRGAASDREELIEVLKALGVRKIQCQPFSYSVASLDGAQKYVVYQLSGTKS
jgi:2-polyprenyl-3-methyl-5-hydroxy-6-metoxy-1,4-benzoquinol methylase